MKIIETQSTEVHMLPSGAEWKCEYRKRVYDGKVVERRVFRGWKKQQPIAEVVEVAEVVELEIPWFVRNQTIENQNKLRERKLII